MKTLLFLSFILSMILFEGKTQNYYPLPAQNAWWTVYEYDEFNGVYDDKVYMVDGDTSIGGLIYTKVYQLNDHPTIFDTVKVLHCFMRQDSAAKKIWFIRHYLGETNEKLGYDLSASIGDTVSLPAFDYGNVGDSLYVRINIGWDSVQLNNGDYRIEYGFSCLFNAIPIQFVQGTSAYNSTFPNIYFFWDAFHQSYTKCVEINNSFVWPLGTDSSFCGFNLVGVSENSDFLYNLAPNPADNYTIITVSTTQIMRSLSCFDILGKCLMDYKLDSGQNTCRLNLDNYPSGIYIIALQFSTGMHYEKLIINH